MATVPEEASIRGSSLTETGYDGEGETYANACKILHDVTFRSLHSNDYNVRRSAPGWPFEEAVPWCLGLVGYDLDDLDRLHCVQITATKGKGSTSAFVACILQELGSSSSSGQAVKIGRFTGPYYVTDRDQIAINGIPVSEELFTRYFWRLWNRMREQEDLDKPGSHRKPTYFFFILALVLIIFLEEKVDVAVVEVFCGGRNDCTSIIKRPLVVSVGSIGVDHVRELGGTEESIAWEKSGLYKPGCAAVTLRQKKPGLNSIIERVAREARVRSLTVLDAPFPEVEALSLGIAGNKSALNASLAITIVQAFLSHPKRPSAFTEVGRKLRTSGLGKFNMAHENIAQPQAPSAIVLRMKAIRKTAFSNVTPVRVWTALLLTSVASLYIPERHLGSLNTFAVLGSLQVLALALPFLVRLQRSHFPRRPWERLPSILASLPSVEVSKQLVISPAVACAIQNVRFPGRGDVIPDTQVQNLFWLMEAAHTPCSMPTAGAWASQIWGTDKGLRILIVVVEPYRPARKMFDAFLTTLSRTQPITHVIFASDVVYRSSYNYDPSLILLDDLSSAWSAACAAARMQTGQMIKVATIEDAVDRARKLAKDEAEQAWALTISVWPGDVHCAARLPVDFGRGCIVTPV